MPEFFRAWLQTLSREQADELWDWLDGDPDAVGETMDAIPFDAVPMEREPKQKPLRSIWGLAEDWQ